MSIASVMSKPVVSVEMDDTVGLIKEIFDSSQFHHLLVVESGRLHGIISDRDLLKTISPNIGTIAETTKDTATLNKKAHQIMTRSPVTLNVDADIYDAIDIFNSHRISCIPIVDDNQKPVGIVSWRDIMKRLARGRSVQAQKAQQQEDS